MDESTIPAKGTRRAVVAAGIVGALWGFGGYFVLWGYTPLTTNRTFVLSPAGWAVFFPVRIVLVAIREAENGVGRVFELSSSHRFIGVLAALLGAGIGAVAGWITATLVTRGRVRAASAESS